MTTSAAFWIGFHVVIFILMLIDLKLIQKEGQPMGIKRATGWYLVCMSMALLFDVGIYYCMGKEKALLFLTGYIIEQSLSVDNLFVFLMIFNYFAVPERFQPRVLHWGILGAIFMRFIFIFAGAAIISAFHWILYIFGGLLIWTGGKMFFEGDEEKKVEPEKNFLLKQFKKIVPVAARDIKDEKFFIREKGILHATPLFLVLLMVESSDLVFAMDSIPAIFAVTRDTFIVYTSNIFAILGLRALYFLLSSLVPLFHYLKYGIAIVLAFIGVKMVFMDVYHISTHVSLMVVVGVLIASVILSVLKKKNANV